MTRNSVGGVRKNLTITTETDRRMTALRRACHLQTEAEVVREAVSWLTQIVKFQALGYDFVATQGKGSDAHTLTLPRAFSRAALLDLVEATPDGDVDATGLLNVLGLEVQDVKTLAKPTPGKPTFQVA